MKFMNNIGKDLRYIELDEKLSKYEAGFDKDTTYLYKMVDMYEELSWTFYHDLADSIELRVQEYASKELLDYISKKSSEHYGPLIKVIEYTLSHSDKK